MGNSSADEAAIDALDQSREIAIVVGVVKYLNNIVELDNRAIKRVTRPMINFKSLRSAGSVLAGIKLMYMIRQSHFSIDCATRCL